MLREEQITENCKDFGLGENIINNIITEMEENDYDELGLGYMIFNNSENLRKSEIAKKLGIDYRTLDLFCKNFGAKKGTWCKKAKTFYEENKNKKYRTTESGITFINSLDYLSKSSFEKEILEYCMNNRKLSTIRKNFKYPHCVHNVSKMLKLGFLE